MTEATAKEGRSGGQGGVLDSLENSSPLKEPSGLSGPSRRLSNRGASRRASLHRLQQGITLRSSIRGCSRFSVMPDGGSVAHGGESPWLGGFNSCGSSGCASCAPKKEAENGSEIEGILHAALKSGATVLFCTFTASNRGYSATSASLFKFYEKLHRLWDLSFGSSWWGARASAYGALGFVRVTETQIRHEEGAEGFHPHIHAALVCDRQMSDEEVLELSLLLERRWVECAPRRGLAVSVDAQDVKRASGADVAAYIAKGAALELSQSAVKGGRESVSWLGLLGLIQDAKGTADYDRLVSLYRAYEVGSKGRRTLSISRALRERYGVASSAEVDVVQVELETEDESDVGVESPDPDKEPIYLSAELTGALLKTRTRAELLHLLHGRDFVKALRGYAGLPLGSNAESSWRQFLRHWLEECLQTPHGLPSGIKLPWELQ